MHKSLSFVPFSRSWKKGTRLISLLTNLHPSYLKENYKEIVLSASILAICCAVLSVNIMHGHGGVYMYIFFAKYMYEYSSTTLPS